MVWAFVSGLLVAFCGAFFAHLLVSYRNERNQHEEFIEVLSQIADLSHEDLREAGQAAAEAQNQDVHPAEVLHQGSRAWRLRKRLHNSTGPLYSDLNSNCKDHLDRIDTWYAKIGNGGIVTRQFHDHIAGGAGDALNEVSTYNFLTFLKSYLGYYEQSHPGTMSFKAAQQAKVKDALRARQKAPDEDVSDPNHQDQERE